MILRFEVENFRSFREPAALSFVATARREAPSPVRQSRHAPYGVLPVVGVWGANAAGKSNLLLALLRVRDLVAGSFISAQPDAPVPWEPWALRFADARPGRVELDLLTAEDVRLQFGFEVDALGFRSEWLYRYEGARRQVLYTRERGLGEERAPVWYFGPSLTGAKQHITSATRDNALFLSAAAQHNHPLLTEVRHAIVRGLQPERRVELRGFPVFAADDEVLSEAFRPTLLRLLAAADLGVSGLRIEEMTEELPDPVAIERIFHPEFLAKLRREPIGGKRVVVRLGHGPVETHWELPPEHESRGTNLLLARISDLHRALATGTTLILDELDTSLHPDLCTEILRLFTDPRTNPNGAQLLFTTHDRGLLEALRSDEVVLVDKGADGVSRLAAASDYKAIRTRDSLRRAHEQGRLRGVPVLGDLVEALAPEAGARGGR